MRMSWTETVPFFQQHIYYRQTLFLEGGMNNAVFIQWCNVLVHHVQHLTSNGSKTLLYMMHCERTYHFAVWPFWKTVVKKFCYFGTHMRHNSTIRLAVFGPFKKYINEELYSIMSARRAAESCEGRYPRTISMLDICATFRGAYDKSFTRINICMRFERIGIFPFHSDVTTCCADLFRPVMKMWHSCHSGITEANDDGYVVSALYMCRQLWNWCIRRIYKYDKRNIIGILLGTESN